MFAVKVAVAASLLLRGIGAFDAFNELEAMEGELMELIDGIKGKAGGLNTEDQKYSEQLRRLSDTFSYDFAETGILDLEVTMSLASDSSPAELNEDQDFIDFMNTALTDSTNTVDLSDITKTTCSNGGELRRTLLADFDNIIVTFNISKSFSAAPNAAVNVTELAAIFVNKTITQIVTALTKTGSLSRFQTLVNAALGAAGSAISVNIDEDFSIVKVKAAKATLLITSTDAPTPSPTPVPTVEVPTAVPTAVPTSTPTAVPSPAPTPAPSTAIPSYVPTASPTMTPTTAMPSYEPTAEPTFEPTAEPTMEPTADPTGYKPTYKPTQNPTNKKNLEDCRMCEDKCKAKGTKKKKCQNKKCRKECDRDKKGVINF